jgi:23S rRNA-/tRNA-specific pseudouridylate synthase
LYFAKSKKIYEEYKLKQNQNLIQKFYIAQVKGNPFFKNKRDEIQIDYPIMHHKFLEEKMISIKKISDISKGGGKQHKVFTNISLLDFDQLKNRSTLLIRINKGIRHQIRVHLSSIGCPIIGETLYQKTKNKEFLHLRSI